MSTIVYSTVIYALIILIGGVIGFVKAGSIPSLAMGVVFASLLILTALQVHKKMIIGVYLSAILTGFLALFFCYRFFSSYKFMPAGLILLLSLINLAVIFWNRPRE